MTGTAATQGRGSAFHRTFSEAVRAECLFLDGFGGSTIREPTVENPSIKLAPFTHSHIYVRTCPDPIQKPAPLPTPFSGLLNFLLIHTGLRQPPPPPPPPPPPEQPPGPRPPSQAQRKQQDAGVGASSKETGAAGNWAAAVSGAGAAAAATAAAVEEGRGGVEDAEASLRDLRCVWGAVWFVFYGAAVVPTCFLGCPPTNRTIASDGGPPIDKTPYISPPQTKTGPATSPTPTCSPPPTPPPASPASPPST